MEGHLQRVFGRNVRAVRVARGYSQEAFADEVMHVHRTYWGAVERGDRNLSLQSVEKIAEALKMDPVALLRE
ncbi:Cro/Cl family transcriptional regulator [Tsukamurella tyrosinosolvens]|nr:Cro/Cl family transcriptional regulator [Tsukamurella tyrosinosolvens]